MERGKVMTTAGVSAGIDMALTLVYRITNNQVAKTNPARHRIRGPARPRYRIAEQGTGQDRRAHDQPRQAVRLVHNKSKALATNRGIEDLVVVAGFSGAGKSPAMATFEDAGYFCVDNLPPEMIGSLSERSSARARRSSGPPSCPMFAAASSSTGS